MQPLENGSETRVDAGNKPNQAKEGETHVLEKAFNLEESEEALPAKPLLKTFNLQLQEGGVLWCGLGIVGIDASERQKTYLDQVGLWHVKEEASSVQVAFDT